MNSSFIMALCTVPDLPEAKRIARHIISNKLAACCNIVPGITSVYAWEGEICEDQEYLLLIKTIRDRADVLTAEIESIHSYDVPEVITFDINDGSKNYLNWMEKYVCSK